jgi:hypothetical protein
VANKISKWLVPEKYFVSFPMSAHDIYSLREYRREIANPKVNFFLTYNDKNVKGQLPLSFTMTGEDFIQCRRKINQLTTREFLPPSPGEKYPSKRLPLAERWSAKNFNFNQVFSEVNEIDSHSVELEWAYDMSTWEGYRAFLGSEKVIEKPYKGLTGPHKHATLVE